MGGSSSTEWLDEAAACDACRGEKDLELKGDMELKGGLDLMGDIELK